MAKSIDFLNNITINFNSNLFSSAAKAHNWHTAAQNLCRALSFVLDMAKRLNDYEREDATCTTYNGFYGADELCFNLPSATRRSYQGLTGILSNYYTASGGFYLAAQQAATKMWGLSSTELPSDLFPSVPPDKNYSLRNQDYSTLIGMLESLDIPVADYWKVDRVLSTELEDGQSFQVSNTTSYFNGRLLRAGDTSSFTQYTIHNFFSAVYNIRGHARILKIMMDNTPTGSRGGRTFPTSYSLRDCLYSLPQFQPHDIVRIRQALTKVRAQIVNTGYDPYNPGTRIKDRIKSVLTTYGINFATAELNDYVNDPTDFYTRAAKINDPLIIAAAGFAALRQADTFETQGWWDSLVPAVHICRKYLMRRYAVAYDYKEDSNPNAFEKAGGRVNYRQSNLRVWLNSRCSSASAWKVPTHDYDAYYSTSQYPYLNVISSTLRANIAKTSLAFNRAETLDDVMSDFGGPLRGTMTWCFLPTLTMFGIRNHSDSRYWNNGKVQLGLDCANLTDGMGNDYAEGWAIEGDLNGEYVAFEEPEVSVDLIENAWELGDRRLQFKVNPECSDASTARTDLYIPTSTPAVNKDDTKDATIPNRVACFYLPKTDGTSTSYQMGITSPYNYQPCTYAFALVPFHTAETDNVAAELVTEPALRYGTTDYE